jgi:hypothetical protein
MGIFRKVGDDKEFTLTTCIPSVQLTTVDEQARAVRERCNWDLKIADDLTELSPPTAEELLWLRLFHSGSQVMAE